MKPKAVDLSVSIRSSAIPAAVKAEVVRALECYFFDVQVKLKGEDGIDEA